MNILYISEDYFLTKVHHNLCMNLAKLGHTITIYAVKRGSNSIETTYTGINYKVLTYVYEKSRLRYKVDFRYKIKEKYGYLKSHIELQKFDVVLAATLFSEGSIAYKIFCDYGIPYIVSVRGTDLNLYLRKFVHLWPLGKQIVAKASQIVFITENLKQKFETSFFVRTFLKGGVNKGCVIPNGIDSVWMEHLHLTRTQNLGNRIVYIGRFDSNKNVERLLKAVLLLSKEFPDLHLSLIGGGGNRHENVMKICEMYPNLFSYLGKIYDKNELMKIMRNHGIFAMISHSETFGLVYVEALSQGLPILYTKGQGVDGTFYKRIGESAISSSLESIVSALRKLVIGWTDYELLSEEDIRLFSWSSIAEKYSNNIIEKISKKKL